MPAPRAMPREHGRRITALVRSLQRSEGLCVLGAGNCRDLELAELTPLFGSVRVVGHETAGPALGAFDVVLSAGLLGQLCEPLVTHLLTVARLLRSGGSAVLLIGASLGARAEPKLGLVLSLLREHPELAKSVRDLRLIEPWTWAVEGGRTVAQAVVFRRAEASLSL